MNRRIRRNLIAGGAALGSVAVAVTAFGSAGRDDSHITYWAARALAEGRGIVNYNGETVEQSSSLAHVVVLAVLHRITGIDLSTLGLGVGLAGLAATVAITVVVASQRSLTAGAAAGIVCGLAAPMTYWATGGLETTLVTAAWVALCWALDGATRDRRALVGVAAAAATIVAARPEGVLLLTGTAGVLLVAALALRRWKQDATWVLPTATAFTAGVVAFAAISVWRLQRGGSILPRPAQVKTGGLRIEEGLRYASDTFGNPAWLLLGAAAAAGIWWLISTRTTRLSWWAATAGAAVTAAAVTGGGGDWMEGGRMYAPTVALASIPAALGVAWAAGRGRRHAAIALTCTALLAVIPTVAMMSTTSMVRPLWIPVTAGGDEPATSGTWAERRSPIHHRDLLFEADVIETVTNARDALRSDRPLRIASGQAGMVADRVFRTVDGPLLFMDRYGLTGAEFDGCSEGLAPTALGHVLDWETALSGCAPLPDVIYDIGRFDDEPALRDAGYVLVHQQLGTFDGPGGDVSADQYVAVRRTLLENADD